MVQNSSILPQCIRAYKSNIAGFGIGIRYTEDVEETEEMKAEWDMAEEVLELLSMEKDTKEVFEDIIDARETYGISYLELSEIWQAKYGKSSSFVILRLLKRQNRLTPISQSLFGTMARK